MATANLHLLPKLAAAFPQYHAAISSTAAQNAATPQGEPTAADALTAAGMPQGGTALRPGEPMGEYVQVAAATEAAAALGLKASHVARSSLRYVDGHTI